MDGLHYREIAWLAPQIRAGKLSPVALTEALLARIDALDPRLHARGQAQVVHDGEQVAVAVEAGVAAGLGPETAEAREGVGVDAAADPRGRLQHQHR